MKLKALIVKYVVSKTLNLLVLMRQPFRRMRQMTDLNNKTILVTGAAGFIGSNLVLELMKKVSPVTIIGIDNMNDYYDVSIKEWRFAAIEELAKERTDASWTFVKGSIADKTLIDKMFAFFSPDIVVNLAEQAGALFHYESRCVY